MEKFGYLYTYKSQEQTYLPYCFGEKLYTDLTDCFHAAIKNPIDAPDGLNLK